MYIASNLGFRHLWELSKLERASSCLVQHPINLPPYTNGRKALRLAGVLPLNNNGPDAVGTDSRCCSFDVVGFTFETRRANIIAAFDMCHRVARIYRHDAR